MAADADDYDWRRVEFDEYKDFLIGAVNDQSDLYLYLASKHSDAFLQILGAFKQQFTIRLTPAGQGKSPVEIRCSYREGNNRYLQEGLPTESQPRNLSDILSKVEILRPGKDPSPAGQENVQIAVGTVRKEVFYEVSIPLQVIASSSESIDVLHVDLETSAMDPIVLEQLKEKRLEMIRNLENGMRDEAKRLAKPISPSAPGGVQRFGEGSGGTGPGQGGGGEVGGGQGGADGGHKRRGGPEGPNIPDIPAPFKFHFDLKLAAGPGRP